MKRQRWLTHSDRHKEGVRDAVSSILHLGPHLRVYYLTDILPKFETHHSRDTIFMKSNLFDQYE